MKIVNYPHPALREKCKPVTALDESVRTAAAKMLELMYEHDGLGLAAPQVALDYQMLVINFKGEPKDKDAELVAINPVIIESQGAEKDREGCLSFPGLYQDIRRAKTVKVQYYTLDGQLQEMLCHDLPARIWQHEIDHLNGVLFIDRMAPSAKMGSKKMVEELIAKYESDFKKGKIDPGLSPKL